MATIEITDENFEEKVLKSKTPVLLDFFATWCGPCKAISKPLEEISEEFKDKLIVGKINIDDNPNTPVKMGCRGIPLLILFKDGKAVDQKVGAASKDSYVTWLKSKLA